MYTVAAKENVILGKYFETFETGANGYVVTFQESSEIIDEFPKWEPFNQKIGKFWELNQNFGMQIASKIYSKIWV